MSSTANYLAIDLGASSGRAVLGTFNGRRLQVEEVHRFANRPVDIVGTLRWNALELFEQIKAGLRKAAAGGLPLDGVGIDTWGVDYALLSRAGNLLGLPYHYRDARTDGMMQEAFGRVARERIYERTGIQFMQINTVYQLLADSMHDPQRLVAADALLFMPDLINYWLTGVQSSELSIASTSQMYDTESGRWAEDVIDGLGLPSRIMPPVMTPGTAVGPVLSAILEETGLSATRVIAPACHDTACAVAAVPATGDDWAYISLGTWSLVGVELAAPIRTVEAMRANMTNEGGIAGTVRFLRNVAGLWLVQECVRWWEREGGARAGEGVSLPAGKSEADAYERFTALAAGAPALVSLIDPDDPRFSQPGDMPARIRSYCAEKGQPTPNSGGGLVRCILDSLALTHRSVIESIQRLTGRVIRRIHIVGGGVHNRLLCQLTADATGRAVIAGPAEATAVGNCLVQAMGAGRLKSAAEIREIVAASFELRTYEPRQTGMWDEAFERFRAIASKPAASSAADAGSGTV